MSWSFAFQKLKPITALVNGSELPAVGRIQSQFPAQMADVHIQTPSVDGQAFDAQQFIKVRTRHHAPSLHEQIEGNDSFRTGQGHRHTIEQNHFVVVVDAQVANFFYFCSLISWLESSQQGLYARMQNTDDGWLDDVIVCASHEHLGHIVFVIVAGHEDHRRHAVDFFQALHDFSARHVGQMQVEQADIMVVVDQMAQARLPSGEVRHGVVTNLKLSANVGRKRDIVLHEDNFDRGIESRGMGSHGAWVRKVLNRTLSTLPRLASSVVGNVRAMGSSQSTAQTGGLDGPRGATDDQP